MTDVDATLSVIGGRLALAHLLLRRLTTPLGGLVGYPEYGFDVRSLIGSDLLPSFVEDRVREQMLAEEQVSEARAAAALEARTGVLTITVAIVSSEGPFELTLTASQLTLEAFLDGSLIWSEAANAAAGAG